MREEEEEEERSCEGSMSFHERLAAVLSKPYSRREYNELWKRVSCRAGEQQGRNLRSREVTFMIGKPGKSYLDHYPGSSLPCFPLSFFSMLHIICTIS